MKLKLFIFAVIMTFIGIFLDLQDIADPHLSEPLFVFGGTVALSLLLILVLRGSWELWKKFALVGIPVMLVLYFVTPVTSGIPYPINRELMMWVCATLFALLSFGIALVKRSRT